MNIHEYQAKQILKEYGSPISNGLLIENLKDILQITSKLKGKQFVVKAKFMLEEEEKQEASN